MANSTKENPLFYQTDSFIPTVTKADGIYIWDDSGKEYIDGCSGAIVCNIGHNDETVFEAMKEQSKKICFSYRTQFENRPAVDLAEKLVENSAPHLESVFYVSGGSEAVESAIKLCRSYFCSIGQEGRYQIISRTPSYHGGTMGALSLTSYSPLEKHYRPYLQSFPKIPAPYCYRCHYKKTYPDCKLACARALEETILEQGPENVAAFISEPIGGASTGAVVPPEDYYPLIKQICDKYGVLIILDEVMTGFGRTGKLFAYEHWNLEADIIALSKGMASGYYPLGAIMSKKEIVRKVMSQEGFPHGFTYAGNPMGSAVGLAVLRRIINDDLPKNAAEMGIILKKGLLELAKKYSFIGDVRGKGLLTAIEFVQDLDSRTPFDPSLFINKRITEHAFAAGLMIYPRRPINGLSGDHVLIAPPLIVTKEQIEEILNRLDTALSRLAQSL